MAVKATHKGTCQVCHRVQLLPGGKLSKHGYSVDCGFFNGVCFGAEHEPLELSCELVKLDIVRCEKYIDSLNSRIKDLSKKPRTAETYLYVYQGRRFASYVWVKVVLSVVDGVIVAESQNPFRRHPVQGYEIGYTSDVLKAAGELNKKFIDRHLSIELEKIQSHVDRQKKIVANWSVKDLIEKD